MKPLPRAFALFYHYTHVFEAHLNCPYRFQTTVESSCYERKKFNVLLVFATVALKQFSSNLQVAFTRKDFIPARFSQRPEIKERDNQPPVRSHPRHSLSFPPTLCLFALRRTLQLARLLKDKAVEAQACYSLGNTYTLLQDYERAIDYHLKHLVIAQDLNDRWRPLGEFFFRCSCL